MADENVVRMDQEKVEKLFGDIVEKKLTSLKEELKAQGASEEAIAAAKKQLEAEESKKASGRAAEFDALVAASREQSSKGIKQDSPLEMVGKMAIAGFAALGESKGKTLVDKSIAVDMVKKMYPESKALHEVMKKDLEMGVPSAGGYTIPQVLAPDVVNALYAQTLLDKLGAVKTPMPNGNFRMARMDTSSSAGWVGEVVGNTPTQPVFGDINLQAKKLYALTALSNSLLRYNSVGLDSWVSRDLANKARIALDSAAFYGTGTLYQPRGLSNTTGIQTSGSSSTAFAVDTPNSMMALLENANVPMANVAWALNPIGKSWILSEAFSSGPFAWANEMNMAKTLAGAPFYSSSTISYTDTTTDYADFWLGDWSEFIWGVGYDISLEISREGSYVSSGTTYSAFQRDETLIRLVAEHDFETKHPNAFVKGIYSVS